MRVPTDGSAAPWEAVAYSATVEDPSVTAARRAAAALEAPLPSEPAPPRRWAIDAPIAAAGALLVYWSLVNLGSVFGRFLLGTFVIGGLMLVRGLTGRWPDAYWPTVLRLLIVLAIVASALLYLLLRGSS